jgi:hypothetical protein
MSTDTADRQLPGSQLDLFAGSDSDYEVRVIDKRMTHYFLLNIHYARRLPSISFAYGLFLQGEIVGVITYGTPASPSLCHGIAGQTWKPHVIELNRLCLLNNKPNEASRLVGGSLRLLPAPKIVVSYADTAQDHLGYVYQATNFLYTGITVKRTEWAVKGLEHLHTKALVNMTNGGGIDAIREKFGENFYYRERSQKHRYLYFVGNKTQRKHFKKALNYPILPFPKTTQND